MITDENLPLCPECGRKLIPAAIKIDDAVLYVFICTCHNDRDANSIQDARKHGNMLVIDFNPENSCGIECADCLFAAICNKTPSPDPTLN